MVRVASEHQLHGFCSGDDPQHDQSFRSGSILKAAPRRPRVSARALGADERQVVLDLLRSDRFVDVARAEVSRARWSHPSVGRPLPSSLGDIRGWRWSSKVAQHPLRSVRKIDDDAPRGALRPARWVTFADSRAIPVACGIARLKSLSFATSTSFANC